MTETLAESEIRYRRLFEAAQDGILILNADTGQIDDANPFLINILGYSLKEILHKRLWEIGPFKDIFRSKTNFKTLQTKKYIRYENLPIQTKKRRIINVEFISNVYLVNRKKVIQCIIRDITDRVTTRQALEDLSARQKMLLSKIPDIIPDIVMEVDNGKIYRWANKAGFEFFGKNVLGKKAAYYFEGAQKTYEVVNPLFGGSENTFYLESWQRRKDGEKRLLGWWCRVLKDNKGNVTGALSSARDITDQKVLADTLRERSARLDEAIAKDEALIASIGDGVIATNIAERGRITFINKAAELMLGFKTKEVLGKLLNDVVSIEDESGNTIAMEKQPMAVALSLAATTTTSLSGPSYYFVRKDGSKFPVAITATPIILNDKIVGAVEVFRDITHDKEVDAEKSEFVSLASHQLRTPTTTLKWYSEMLLAGEVGPLNPEQRRYLKEIYHSNKRMIELVNSLLTVSRIELGTFAIEPKLTSTEKIVDELLEEQEMMITEKKLRIEKDYEKDTPKIKSDPILVRVILQNILLNAMEYTPKEGIINIKIKHIELGVQIAVKDNGCGIPLNAQSRIFTKFFRADNAVVIKTDGNGLGLYITKSIMEALKGTITFKSKVGLGTTFFVTFPIQGVAKRESTKSIT